MGSRSDPGSDGWGCSGNSDAGPVVGPGPIACFKNAPLERGLRPQDRDRDPDVQHGRIVVRISALTDRNVREIFGEIAANHRRGQNARGGRYGTGCVDLRLGSNRPRRPLQNRQRRQNDWEEAEERASDHRCRSPMPQPAAVLSCHDRRRATTRAAITLPRAGNVLIQHKNQGWCGRLDSNQHDLRR
jgi:hypothetical protein